VVKAIQAGVSDFITKPFTSDELLKKTTKQLTKIGKSPKDAFKAASSGNDVGFASVEVLTGGASQAAPTMSKPASGSLAALTGGASAAAKSVPQKTSAAKKVAPKKSAKTKAQLRFPNSTCACVVRDMSLQALSGLMQRSDPLPGLFEQAVVDIETDAGDVARVNGYLSSIAAGENKVDTNIIKVSIRFVDNDPEKFEALSKFIAKIR